MGYEARHRALGGRDAAGPVTSSTTRTGSTSAAYEALPTNTGPSEVHRRPPLVYPAQDQTLEYLEEQGQAVSGSGGDWWTSYIPYVPRRDKQHTTRTSASTWFVSGWSDYAPPSIRLVASHARENVSRDARRGNDDLDTADSFIWVSLAARVFSIAETAIIVHIRREDGAQASTGARPPVALRASRAVSQRQLALEIQFK
jgi:hypothetical protein